MAEEVPDPARSYERAQPEKESGMGRLDNNIATPTDRADKMDEAVDNRHKPHQINAEDDHSPAAGPGAPPNRDQSNRAKPEKDQPDHSMHDEEPLGWDQAPADIHNPRDKRHPRKEGKGGTR